jgi:membrane protease YdiL (CAAX protease family)
MAMDRRADGATAVLEPGGRQGPGPAAPAPSPSASRVAGRTVAALIGANLVLQIILVVVIVSQHLGVVSAVRISLVVGVVFYAVTAIAVGAWSSGLGLRPRLGTGDGLTGVAEGVVVGGGAAVLLSGLLRLLLGRPLLDPTSGVLASGGAAWLLLGVLVVAVLAPVVEEFVFRGFLLEAFRARGQVSAVVLSGVAFSLAHLSVAQFRYYLVMGMAFSVVYWRRGLIGSIAAHAAFNATLLAVAVVAMHAPAREVSSAGFTVSVPASWSSVSGVPGDDLVLRGPVGTRVELGHVDLPRPVDVDALARDLSKGSFSSPAHVAIDAASVTRIDLAGGRAVTMAAQVGDRDGRVVMIPKGTRLWLAVLRTATDDRSAVDFDRIVRSWRLP